MAPMSVSRARRLGGGVVAVSGLVCPCHVLTGLVLAAGVLFLGVAPALDADAQDGIHALYLPTAVAAGAWLLAGPSGRGR